MQLKYPISSNLMTHMTFVARQLKSVVRRNGDVNLSQYRVLAYLLRNGDEKNPKTIAQGLSLSPSSIAETVASLEERGYVTCSECAEDRRLKRVSLTEKGAKEAEDIELAAAAFVNKLWRPLSNEQRAAIISGCAAADAAQKPSQNRHDGVRAILLYVENALIVNAKLAGTVAGEGLSVGEFRVLFETSFFPRGVRVAQLASSLLLRSNETTVLVEALVKRELVKRRSDPVDRRARLVELTSDGYALLERVAPLVDEMFASGTYDTTAEERAQYLEIGDLVVDNVRRFEK